MSIRNRKLDAAAFEQSPFVSEILPRMCSVCGGALPQSGPLQRWISLRVATDVMPPLVNACSAACIAKLPPGADNYLAVPHEGGNGVRQPTARDERPFSATSGHAGRVSKHAATSTRMADTSSAMLARTGLSAGAANAKARGAARLFVGQSSVRARFSGDGVWRDHL